MSGLSVMARGGYATVYRATQDSVGREVAIKVENRTLDNERDQARFLREARAAGRMSSHPHVVDLFDIGVTGDQHPYLIMELCDGSYADRMRAGPVGAAEARDLGVKIADALAHAHASGVLHRDVKPANILYSHFNSAVLADFGLAVLGEMRDSSVTLEVLTPAYAPPEMFRHAAPSPAVDVYALCATLYAVMRRKPPRWHDDRNPSLVTLIDLFNQPIPDLPGVPPALVEVLRYGMANDPRSRPSAEQLRDLLAAVPIDPGLAAPISGAPISGGPSLGTFGSGSLGSGSSGAGVYVSGSLSPGAYSPVPARPPHQHPRPPSSAAGFAPGPGHPTGSAGSGPGHDSGSGSPHRSGPAYGYGSAHDSGSAHDAGSARESGSGSGSGSGHGTSSGHGSGPGHGSGSAHGSGSPYGGSPAPGQPHGPSIDDATPTVHTGKPRGRLRRFFDGLGT